MKNSQDEKILIAKIIDKINSSKNKNKITVSEFLNNNQISRVKNELKTINTCNYIFWGGFDTAERKAVIVYPKDISEEKAKEADFLKAIKIELPSETYGKYKHKDYLGTVMSLGFGRERFGDIVVYDDLAYIVVLNENAEYIKDSLKLERNFKKANVSVINIADIKPRKLEFEDINITVNSNRLDNIVSEILKTSRKMSQDLIQNEKVSINYIIETKNTKGIRQEDVLTIRGNGKYIVDKFLGKNKKDKEVIGIKKYK